MSCSFEMVKDEIGNTYGYLTVIERAENNKERKHPESLLCYAKP